MKKADFKNKDKATLSGLVVEKREAIRNFRFGTAGSKNRNVRESRTLKRDIARIMTQMTAMKKSATATATATKSS